MILRRVTVVLVVSVMLGHLPATAQPGEAASGRAFYVRQTVGNDTNDGLSPKTAWRSLSRLGSALHAGDVVFVGPGLYREMVTVANSGTAEAMITFIADTTGEHTGDPPGTVMVSGADSMDESVFAPQSATGVYMAPGLHGDLLRVVEMDGLQYRYRNALESPEHIAAKLPVLDVVANMPSTFHHDPATGDLYIHTSDNQAPSGHEIELIRRNFGFLINGKHHVSVIGFTFRHMATAGVGFGQGSSHGLVMDNTSYGNWQGIRISESNDVRVEGNTVFRNGNSGIYFLSGSGRGHAVGNVAYENAKGIRWSSGSDNGVALGNLTFDNREAGIAIEEAGDMRVSSNLVVNNGICQLLLLKSTVSLKENCYLPGSEEQLIAITGYNQRHQTLADFQQATGQDINARENCDPLPRKIDVQRLHTETAGYAEQARRMPVEQSE